MPRPLLAELFRSVRSDERFDWKFPLKGIAFFLCHPALTWRWLRFISAPFMSQLWHAEPRLIDKPLRPYLNAMWSPRQRVEALMTHYGWLDRHFPASTLDAFFGVSHPRLAQWTLATTGQQFAIRLGYCGSFEREGDLSLSLWLEGPDDPASSADDPQPVVSLTFGIADAGGTLTLCVGCVQARNDPGTRALFSTLTRGQHGLRPKPLLLEFARMLAHRWGLQLAGIDPRRHPFTSFRYQLSSSKRKLIGTLNASYTSLWTDAGATTPSKSGWYPLAPRQPERNDTNTPSHKRSMYAKRKLWLDNLQQQASDALDRLEKTA